MCDFHTINFETNILIIPDLIPCIKYSTYERKAASRLTTQFYCPLHIVWKWAYSTVYDQCVFAEYVHHGQQAATQTIERKDIDYMTDISSRQSQHEIALSDMGKNAAIKLQGYLANRSWISEYRLCWFTRDDLLEHCPRIYRDVPICYNQKFSNGLP